MKNKIRSLLGLIILVSGTLLACYLGGWLLFVKPIMESAKAFDADTLTSTMILIAFVKCCFASLVAYIICVISYMVTSALWDY